ncbi:hypothetical protein Leryth_025879 [Lithospermum erythrorhizon]|nr:hypothetical protein Leryth_025879 [Lithospermum erythrorhizon]
MSSGIRVWLYSGDTDGNVPITTTQYAIKKLDVPVETPWYAWYSKGEVLLQNSSILISFLMYQLMLNALCNSRCY